MLGLRLFYLLCFERNTLLVLQGLHSVEAVLQIPDDVVDILGADGEADRVLSDLLLLQLLCREFCMGRGCRMYHQALHICHVGKEGEYLQGIDEGKGLLLAALDVEREDGACPVREVLLIQGVIRMIRKRRMVDLLHERIAL